MPLSTPQIIAVILFASANIIFAASFSHIAIIVYRYYVSGNVKPVYVKGTKILLSPLLIALGGFSFLYSIFTYTLIAWLGIGNVGVEFRFLGTFLTLAGVIFALFGMYRFYATAKIMGAKGGIQ